MHHDFVEAFAPNHVSAARLHLATQPAPEADSCHSEPVVPSDAQAIEMERQREKQMPCSAEWLKTATDVQKKNCLQQSSINQAMNALSARPASANGTTAAASDK